MKAAPSQSRQLPLDLAHRPAFGAEDFFLSTSNELAIRLIDDWPEWPRYGQLLVGPAACGKSHLVNVWRLRSKAIVLAAKDLDDQILQAIEPGCAVCVEDLDRGLASEEALFHLLNRVRELNGQILLSTRTGINELDLRLQDLRSRLLALPGVCINSPDDQLLRAVMIKQFLDRQIQVEPAVVEYIFRRMERSMVAVAQMVDVLDRGAMGAGRAITRPLAREIMQASSISRQKEE